MPSSVSLLGNDFGKDAEALIDAARNKPQLISLCGIKPKETKRDFSFNGLKAADGILLAFDLQKHATLAELKYAASHARL